VAEGERSFLGRIIAKFKGERGERDLVREMEELIEEGSAEGLINSDEGEMLLSVLEFRSTLVREIMIPRTEMVCGEVNASVGEIIKLMIEGGHSRIPIYEGDVDHVVGVVHARDLLEFWGSEDNKISLVQLIRPAYFVPETMAIENLLRELRDRKVHMAIAVDEYGGVSGLATLEDVIEEIIGDIQDEWDDEDEPMVRELSDGYEVDGRCEIEELNEAIGVEMEADGEFETVGGLVLDELGRVPSPGESFTKGDFDFVVRDADKRRVKSVMIRRRKGSGGAEEDGEG